MTVYDESMPRLPHGARGQGLALRLAGLRPHLPYLILLCSGTAFLLALALLHHRAFGTGYDLGIYDQVVWNMAHGRFFMTTLVYETGGYYDHFEPILAIISPLYWLFSDARVLIILQSLALGLGSLPIYLYARCRLGWFGTKAAAMVAPVIAATYLLYPALHNANLNDFHEVGLIPPLLGFALYGLLRGRRRVLFIFLVLCLLVKEDLAITALAISLYIILLQPKGFRRRDGFWMAAITVAWILLVLFVFYPALTRGMSYPFVARRYPWLGDSPQSALHVLLTQPWIVLPHLLQPPKLVFLLRLFGPLLFLPLLGWPVIGLSMPILIYLMLSSYEPQWSVQSYYNPPLLPFIFFALIEAWAYALRWLQTTPGPAACGPGRPHPGAFAGGGLWLSHRRARSGQPDLHRREFHPVGAHPGRRRGVGHGAPGGRRQHGLVAGAAPLSAPAYLHAAAAPARPAGVPGRGKQSGGRRRTALPVCRARRRPAHL